ncbi:MAG TPA: hypothetical protein VNO30_28970 [Kofleriaceae bacterium]|nr:hypothetical protein [Kofleriaceae bacterium]
MATPKPRKPPFPLREGEELVTYSPAASIHKLGATIGRIWLTTERVVFWPVVPIVFWIALPLGLMLYLVNLPQRRELAIGALGTAERTTFGRNRNVLLLGARDLSRDLKVIVDDFDAFTESLSARRRLLASPSSKEP